MMLTIAAWVGVVVLLAIAGQLVELVKAVHQLTEEYAKATKQAADDQRQRSLAPSRRGEWN